MAMQPTVRRKFDSPPNLLERLQAVSSSSLGDPQAILDDLFPEQTCYARASRFLKCMNEDSKSFCSPAQSWSPPKSWRKGSKRRTTSMNTPLRSIASPNSLPLRGRRSIKEGLSESDVQFFLWDVKMDRQDLTREDLLFLLVHEDVVRIFESSRLLQTAHLSYDQVMELELVLDSMRQSADFRNLSSQRTIARILSYKVWKAQNAFGVKHTQQNASSAIQPEGMLSPSHGPKSSYNVLVQHQRHFRQTIPVRHPPRLLSKLTLKQKHTVTSTSEYIRAYCVEELIRATAPSTSFSTKSSSFCQLRRQFAVEKLVITMSIHIEQVMHRRLSKWIAFTRWYNCQVRVSTFCQLKCALWILRRARWRLQRLVLSVWSQWKYSVNEECEQEKFAALLTTQSWRRHLLGKRKAAMHIVNLAATTIQRYWRGFYGRKMAIRRKHFGRFADAAIRIQNGYRRYCFRKRINEYICSSKAARTITRCIRVYCQKRRDFRAWLHRLARYHAAVTIQIWGRRQRKRINLKRERQCIVEAASCVLIRFFRWAKFIIRFGVRVRHLVDSKSRAAVRLQTAYRAKRARAKFYALQDKLEEQRRTEILRVMWENAFASTIQTWWRRKKCKRASANTLAL